MSDSAPQEMRALPGLGFAWAIVGVIGFALLAFVGVGLALPGTWTVERSRDVNAPADSVFALLEDLDRWETWTHWPELRGRTDGAARGEGANRSWDDPNYGSGELTLTEVVPGEHVRYEVVVDGGDILIGGELRLERQAGSTRVLWREEGDFGWNPLLAYMALTMDRMQGSEMDKALDRLEEALREPHARGNGGANPSRGRGDPR